MGEKSDAQRIINDLRIAKKTPLDKLSHIENPSPELNENKDGDPQVISLKTILTQILSEIESPIVMDFGAGKGTLIPILHEIQEFKNGAYIAINRPIIGEELEQKFVKYKFYKNPKSELISFEDFFAYGNDVDVIVIKNVIHEIDSIKELGEVLHNLFDVLSHQRCVVLQDMDILNVPELGNCPYLASDLVSLFETCGFKTTLTKFKSHSGIDLYTLVAEKTNFKNLSSAEIAKMLASIRETQLLTIQKELDEQYSNKTTDDAYNCAIQHFNHYAIQKQISDYKNEKSPISEIEMFKNNLNLNEGNIRIKINNKKRNLIDIPWFSNREKDLNTFTNNFLNSENNIFFLSGPRNIGKTTFAFVSLKSRNPDRKPLYIRIPEYCDYWKFLELLFNELELDISLKDLIEHNKKDISDIILDFISRFAAETIICIDDFENLLEEYNMSDDALEYFLHKLSQIGGIKCLIISSKNFNDSDSLFSNCFDYKLNLFPKDYYVIKMFDGLISKEKYGIDKYPEKLIQAVGKHPAIAYLVAKKIQKSGSIELVLRYELDIIKRQIVDSILDNLNMSPAEENILQIMSLLVRPEKLDVIEKLTDETNLIIKLSEEGLIYFYDDQYFILETIREFYKIHARNSHNYSEICDKIASAYKNESLKYVGNKKIEYYRKYVDFKLSVGVTDLNIDLDDSYFTSEILELADTFYRFNEYEDAIKIYEKLDAKSPSLKYKLKKAASYVRLNEEKGDIIYESLIKEHDSPRIKSSYVSSLIAANRYSTARDKLISYFGSNIENYHPYQIDQRAKIEDNLGNHEIAEDLYYRNLENSLTDYNLNLLINMYMKLYDNQKALDTINLYEKYLPYSRLIRTEKAKVLERNNKPYEASIILEELYKNDNKNAHIVLPYIKILLSLKKFDPLKLDVARDALKASSDSKPRELYIQAQIHVDIESKDFSSAESLLDYYFPEKINSNNSHINSLKATHYYKKAMYLKESNLSAYKESLYKALKYTDLGLEISNIPLLMQRIDILREIGDKTSFDKTLKCIQKINPNITISNQI